LCQNIIIIIISQTNNILISISLISFDYSNKKHSRNRLFERKHNYYLFQLLFISNNFIQIYSSILFLTYKLSFDKKNNKI